MAESVLLQSCFQLLPGKSFFEVRLTRKKLFYQQTSVDSCFNPSKSPLFSINVEDIYGAKVFKRKSEADFNAYLHIFTCPVDGKKRIRKRIRFKVSGWEDVEANIRTAERWLKTILWLVKDPDIDVETVNGKYSFLCLIVSSSSSMIIVIINTLDNPYPFSPSNLPNPYLFCLNVFLGWYTGGYWPLQETNLTLHTIIILYLLSYTMFSRQKTTSPA